jgi:excisionase family DNA binding protein
MSDRIFHGAQEIADHLQLTRRAVYHLIKSGRLPVFRLGTAKIHARQEALDRFIEEQEKRNSSGAANSNAPDKKSAA